MVDLSHLKRGAIEPRSLARSVDIAAQESYAAFHAKDSVVRLRIRPANGPTWSPYYMGLQAIAYDGDYGTNFVLMFGFITIRARGQNLQTLIAALEMGMADFIQGFDPERWSKPASDAPIIEWMVVEQHGGPHQIVETSEVRSKAKAH